MADTALPTEIQSWMDERNWGIHHLEWHQVRNWDRLPQAARDLMTGLGWRRAPIQEGEPGNGLAFLTMHRAMIELLRESFPGQAALFQGWTTPPTDPADPGDPLPGGVLTPFPRVYLDAIDRLTNDLGAFASEDALGLYIETSLRPTPGNPFAVSPEPGAGIHNVLHGRFADSSSPVDMGNPLLNLNNARFWRLHGWIDRVWSGYRAAKGLSDSDPAYLARIAAEKAHLEGHGAHGMAGGPVPAAPPAAFPVTLLSPFRETPAAQFERLMSRSPRIETPDELREFIQAAIRLELFTIPLYLTAYWSILPGHADSPAGVLVSVALQEMLHMGLMCNLLIGVGRPPRINTVAPEYPDYLPGIDSSEMFGLEVLSRAQLKKFLVIELPQHGEIPPGATGGPTPKLKTIGDFYDRMAEALVRLAPQISNNGALITAGQQVALVGGFDTFVIREIGDPANVQPGTALYAIRLIKEQGEGTEVTRGAVDFDGELAHYYRFQQIDLALEFRRQPDGKFKPYPSEAFKLPEPGDLFPMAPVPRGGYPNVPVVEAFDCAYSEMLDNLQDAWANDNPAALDAAVIGMGTLGSKAQDAMRKRPYGPDFRYIPATARTAPGGPGGGGPTPAAAAVPGYARIKQILDDAVLGQAIGAHGPFWRTLSRDQFVVRSVFGRKLIAVRDDGTFDPDESNLLKALEGRPPFGSDLSPPPSGALIERMPLGFPPVPAEKIAEIRAWIAAGCPNQPMSGGPPAPTVDDNAGGPADPAQHVDFWFDFDNRALFQATQAVRDDVETFFVAAGAWRAFALDPGREPEWATAVASTAVSGAVIQLATLQLDTIVAHYGQPLPLLTLLDGFERFGADNLPDDPRRPRRPRHRMDSAFMWFNWSAFVDAVLRTAAAAPASGLRDDFWRAVGRAVLLGLLNDGVFRPNRFTVVGFTADDAGRAAIRAHARGLAAAGLPAELARRFRESGFPAD